jgi:hypothetical protein
MRSLRSHSRRLLLELSEQYEDVWEIIQKGAKDSRIVQQGLLGIRKHIAVVSSRLSWYELDRCGAAIARHTAEESGLTVDLFANSRDNFTDDEWREILRAAELHKVYLQPPCSNA